MYEVWHRQGGKVGGRPRNSIRKMRDEWLVKRHAVPSLHPKLMGRVKLTRSDVRALLDLFLERWRWVGGDAPLSYITTDGYAGFEATDLRRLRDLLTKTFGSTQAKNGRGLLQLPAQELSERVHTDDLRIKTFIESEYRQCDALITFSRDRIAVGPTPSIAMKNFFYFLNQFYQDDIKRNESKCIFVWIIDLGKRIFEDNKSFLEFYNAGFLSLLLQTFSTFDSEDDIRSEGRGKIFRQMRIIDPKKRKERWNWLCERSVVIAENTRWEELDDFYLGEENEINKIRLRDIGITSEHVLPNESPNRWSKSLKKLTGKNKNSENISFTTLLNKKSWISSVDSKYLKQFAHARTIKNTDIGSPNTTIESIELPSAGDLYDEACRLIYYAALHRLKSDKNPNSEEMTAVAYLRKLGFHVLTVHDFIGIFNPRQPKVS